MYRYKAIESMSINGRMDEQTNRPTNQPHNQSINQITKLPATASFQTLVIDTALLMMQ